MNTTEFLACLLKLLGVYCLVLFFELLPRDYYYIKTGIIDGDSWIVILFSASNLILFLVASFVFMSFPNLLARFLYPDAKEISFDVSESGVVRGGCIVIGIYVLSWAIPDFFHNAISIIKLSEFAEFDDFKMTEAILSEITTVLEIAIALYLIFGSKGIYNLIEKIRG